MDAALPVVEPMALVHDRYAVHVGVLDPAKASTIRENVRSGGKLRHFVCQCLESRGPSTLVSFG